MSLAETYLDLAKRWYPTKDGDLTLNNFNFGAKKNWWKCNKAINHDYQAQIQERSWGRGCSYCSGKMVVL